MISAPVLKDPDGVRLIAQSFAAGTPLDDPQLVQNRTYRLSTSAGTFAVRYHGEALPDGGIDGPYASREDVDLTLMWTRRCWETNRCMPELLLAAGHVTAEFGRSVISVQRWAEGTHPGATSHPQAALQGRLVGDALGRFHAVGMNSAGGCSTDLSYRPNDWDYIASSHRLNTGLRRRLDHLRPALQRLDAVLDYGAVQSVGTIVHGDTGSGNVIVDFPADTAHLIDFDPCFGGYGSALEEIANVHCFIGGGNRAAYDRLATTFRTAAHDAYLKVVGHLLPNAADFAVALQYPAAKRLVDGIKKGETHRVIDAAMTNLEYTFGVEAPALVR